MTMVRRPRDEVLFPGQYQSWVSTVDDIPSVQSEFERIMLLSGGSAGKKGRLIGVLLASACPMNNDGCEVLRPLWAEEAMHRAHGFMRLIDALNSRGSALRENPIAAWAEDFAARDLVMRFRELETAGDRAARPCSTVLRNVVADLGVLFGRPVNIALRTKIDRVSLPAYKRRALVLAASELLCNAMLHAFPGREAGLIEVGLTRRGRRHACLRVADNGIGFRDPGPNLDRGVASGLAGLLEADLAYEREAGWTIAEILFPVRGP